MSGAAFKAVKLDGRWCVVERATGLITMRCDSREEAQAWRDFYNENGA